MDLSKIPSGKDLPTDINVVIEIPQGSQVKYEIDKESGAVFVDRFLFTPMAYPAAYGFIPGTLAADGDPADALVLANAQVLPGVVIRARPIGMLQMEDEAGQDEKIICVPHDKVHTIYTGTKSRVRAARDRPPRHRALLHPLQGPRTRQMGQGHRLGRPRGRRGRDPQIPPGGAEVGNLTVSGNIALDLLRAIQGDIAGLKTGVIEIKQRLGMLEAQGASLSRRIDRLSGDAAQTKRRLNLVDAS